MTINKSNKKIIQTRITPPNYSYFPKKGERSLHWNFEILNETKKHELFKKLLKTRFNHYNIRGLIYEIQDFYHHYNRRTPLEWKTMIENKENYENFEILETISIKENEWFLLHLKEIYHELKFNYDFYYKYLHCVSIKLTTEFANLDNQIYGRYLKKKMSKKEINDLTQESYFFSFFYEKVNHYFNVNLNYWPLHDNMEEYYYDGLEELLKYILLLDLDHPCHGFPFNIFNDSDSDSSSDSDSDNHLPNYSHRNRMINNCQSEEIILID